MTCGAGDGDVPGGGRVAVASAVGAGLRGIITPCPLGDVAREAQGRLDTGQSLFEKHPVHPEARRFVEETALDGSADVPRSAPEALGNGTDGMKEGRVDHDS